MIMPNERLEGSGALISRRRRKAMTEKQLAANRRNARKSTGPRTPEGRARAGQNALRHGILSMHLVVGGRGAAEDPRELAALHRRFTEHYQPVGPLEELQVEQIVVAQWRLRRVRKAEAAEARLSADRIVTKRDQDGPPVTPVTPLPRGKDIARVMEQSADGWAVIADQLGKVRTAVEAAGELTEAATRIPFAGEPNALSAELEALRLRLAANPDGLEPAALREANRQRVLTRLDRDLERAQAQGEIHQQREAEEEAAACAAAAVPPAFILDKLLRYEVKLELQLYRAMHHLERLQRQRQGEAVPVPVIVETSGGGAG